MRTHYRGRILIQASLKVEREEARKLKLDPDELSTGAIVGSVQIVDHAVARSADSPVLGKVHNVQESLAERD